MIKKLQFLFTILFILILSNTTVNSQNSLHFDGVNDYLSTTWTGISGGSARTIEAWIKTTANANPNAGGVQRVIADWGNTSTGSRFTFNVLFNNAIRLEAQGNGLSGTIPVNDGNWHHVAAVFDPSATNKISLYVDGVLDIAGNLTVTINTLTTTPFRIGRRIDNINHFEGSIDEVRVWNVARTASEISANKNVEFCSPQTGLVAYYKFNMGVASGTNSGITTISDYSGNNYTGTLNGFAMSGATSNIVTGASLTLNTIDTTITNDNAGTLTANQSGAIYQWVDCATSNIVSGANSQTFSPSTAGSYSAIVNLNGCISTTACSNVTTLNNSDFNFRDSITLYPNPSNGVLNIKTNESYETIEVIIKNNIGQIISNKQFLNTNNIVLNIDSETRLYFVSLKTNSGKQATLKFIKL